MDIHEMRKAKVSVLYLKLDNLDEHISIIMGLSDEFSKSSVSYLHESLKIIEIIHSRKYREKENFVEKLDDIADYYRILGNREMERDFLNRAEFLRREILHRHEI